MMAAAATLGETACFDMGGPDRVLQSHEPGEAKIEHARSDLEALLIAANAGDARAFARFLSEVLPLIRKVVRARGRGLPQDQHEDVVQEVLLAIHLKRQTWDPATPLRPWLYAVTRYKVVDAFRHKGMIIHLPLDDFADIIEDETQANRSGDDVHAMLSQIDQRSATIVRAIGIQGERASEVGARMSMSEGAVRVAFHRAIRKLAALARGFDK